jgi:excisionase family DNA binding protein
MSRSNLTTIPGHAATADVGVAVGPATLSVEQAAQRLGISRSTAYECVRNGSIPSLRFRRRIVIPAAVIEQMLSGAVVDEDRSISAAS